MTVFAEFGGRMTTDVSSSGSDGMLEYTSAPVELDMRSTAKGIVVVDVYLISWEPSFTMLTVMFIGSPAAYESFSSASTKCAFEGVSSSVFCAHPHRNTAQSRTRQSNERGQAMITRRIYHNGCI